MLCASGCADCCWSLLGALPSYRSSLFVLCKQNACTPLRKTWIRSCRLPCSTADDACLFSVCLLCWCAVVIPVALILAGSRLEHRVGMAWHCRIFPLTTLLWPLRTCSVPVDASFITSLFRCGVICMAPLQSGFLAFLAAHPYFARQ